MAYKLAFLQKSKKEWDKLNPSVREQFKKKLKERLENPHVPNDKLSGLNNIYKIKLGALGYRLAYEVRDDTVIVIVLVVGKREKGTVYRTLTKRMKGEEAE